MQLRTYELVNLLILHRQKDKVVHLNLILLVYELIWLGDILEAPQGPLGVPGPPQQSSIELSTHPVVGCLGSMLLTVFLCSVIHSG